MTLNTQSTRSRSFLRALLSGTSACIAVGVLSCNSAVADDAVFSGEIGAGVLRTQSIIRGDSTSTGPMPYLAFDYGPVFARIDTFGVKTFKMGYGNLEILGRYRADGYQVSNIARRANPVPLGIGTMQVTPIGAFEVNFTHDFANSAGEIALARYIAKIPAGPLNFYPEVGGEMYSSKYANYYYGTRNDDAKVIGQEYTPGSSSSAFAGLLVSAHVAEHWTLNGYYRRTRFGDEISRSPLVSRGIRNSMFLTVAREF